MKLQCYEFGDERVHVDREDDGTFIQASLLTNPNKGFRKMIKKIQNEDVLNCYLDKGFVLTFEREM